MFDYTGGDIIISLSSSLNCQFTLELTVKYVYFKESVFHVKEENG